jgi:predicted Rossmann fold nucleotide-binding protein DprA/Smf involved in DNA uptake
MQAAAPPQLDGAEARVWKALSLQDATSIDTLLAKLALPTSEIYSALLALETAEHIRQLPGKKYIRRL